MVSEDRITILCQYKRLSCFGCCGFDFGSKREIVRVIKNNSEDLKRVRDLLSFRDRYPKYDLDKGLCRNLIDEGGKLICPLHPALNDGKDLRIGHCDINYLCRTAKEFASWPKEEKVSFLRFIDSKKLDNYAYSLGISEGRILEEYKMKVGNDL